MLPECASHVHFSSMHLKYTFHSTQLHQQNVFLPMGVFRSIWLNLGVVGPESQGGQISELTAPMQWPSGAPGNAGDKSARIQED